MRDRLQFCATPHTNIIPDPDMKEEALHAEGHATGTLDLPEDEPLGMERPGFSVAAPGSSHPSPSDSVFIPRLFHCRSPDVSEEIQREIR